MAGRRGRRYGDEEEDVLAVAKLQTTKKGRKEERKKVLSDNVFRVQGEHRFYFFDHTLYASGCIPVIQ